jgi:hypothetical protein
VRLDDRDPESLVARERLLTMVRARFTGLERVRESGADPESAIPELGIAISDALEALIVSSAPDWQAVLDVVGMQLSADSWLVMRALVVAAHESLRADGFVAATDDEVLRRVHDDLLPRLLEDGNAT